MLATIDGLFTSTDFALALGDFKLSIEDIIEANVAFLPPPRRRKPFFLDDFLDDSLDWWVEVSRLRNDGARRAGRHWGWGSLVNNTSRSTSQNLGLAACNFGLANSDVALASKENL